MVIAYIDGDRVLFASDTQVNTKNFKYRVSGAGSGGAVRHIGHGITIGYSGIVQTAEILFFNEEWFDSLGDDKLTKRYLMQEIIPRLYARLSDVGQLNKETVKNGNSAMLTTFLIAQGDRLFYIDTDFSVSKVERYAVIGKLTEFALLRADTIPASDNKEAAMAEVLREMERRTILVSAPYCFTDTAERKFKILEA